MISNDNHNTIDIRIGFKPVYENYYFLETITIMTEGLKKLPIISTNAIMGRQLLTMSNCNWR